MYQCTRKRSLFWLKIYDNDGSINISASTTTAKLIQLAWPNLEDNIPRGWLKSDRYNDMFNLWLPDDCYEPEEIDQLKAWAEKTNAYIWLGINKHTQPFFDGTELDFCVANDWTFDFETNQRTNVGKAESALKYNYRFLTELQRNEYVRIMAHAVHECVLSLPLDLTRYVVTTIPAIRQDQTKLSWALANFVSRKNQLPFVGVTLTRPKPQMKELPLEQKVEVWRNIYSDPTYIESPDELRGKNILIVDDLFQSGASLFCFAEYLKRDLGARDIIAVTSVKAQKDGGNV